MYRIEDKKQQRLENFILPFGGHLNEENRWVLLSEKVPWEEIEQDYAIQFSDNDLGAPAKSLRMALGALIIKEKLQISDRELVEQIKENPYLQYFIGLEGYKDEAPFDPSLLVHFRKRLDGDLINKANEEVFRERKIQEQKKNEKSGKS